MRRLLQHLLWIGLLVGGCGDDDAASSPSEGGNAPADTRDGVSDAYRQKLEKDERQAQVTFAQFRGMQLIARLASDTQRQTAVREFMADPELPDTAKAAMKRLANRYVGSQMPTAAEQQQAINAYAQSVAEFRLSGNRGPVVDLDALRTPMDVAAEVSFAPAQVFGEGLEGEENYSLPLPLSSGEARAFVREVEELQGMMRQLLTAIEEYKNARDRVANTLVLDRLWARLVSGQGFKDQAIGRDWYTEADRYLGIIDSVETMFGDSAKLVRLHVAWRRSESVKLRLIGNRYLLGDRKFVEASHAYLKSELERLRSERNRLTELASRLETEGILSWQERFR